MMRMRVGLMGRAALISISSSVMPMMDSSTMARSSWFHLGANWAQCHAASSPPTSLPFPSRCSPFGQGFPPYHPGSITHRVCPAATLGLTLWRHPTVTLGHALCTPHLCSAPAFADRRLGPPEGRAVALTCSLPLQERHGVLQGTRWPRPTNLSLKNLRNPNATSLSTASMTNTMVNT